MRLCSHCTPIDTNGTSGTGQHLYIPMPINTALHGAWKETPRCGQGLRNSILAAEHAQLPAQFTATNHDTTYMEFACSPCAYGFSSGYCGFLTQAKDMLVG